MIEFDARLKALADCAVIPISETKKEEKKKETKIPDLMGGIVFKPFPTIVAANDLVLSHEICHRLAGKKDYDAFVTAVIARNNCSVFKFTLNLLLDWYHEICYEGYSPFLKAKISELHGVAREIEINRRIKEVPELNYLVQMYKDRTEEPSDVGTRDVHDLVFLANSLVTSIKSRVSQKAFAKLSKAVHIYQQALFEAGITGAGSDSYGNLPLMSDYYAKAVARYSNTIDLLATLWTKNRYDWQHKHYGEINWKNLIRLFIGEKLSWPVFLILSKIILRKNIHLVIDRSGSTGDNGLKEQIMDVAVIITESLRQCNTPVSIIDVGVTDCVINKIDEPVDVNWFTPMAWGGTPLGSVCMTIREKSCDSLLLIITDGEPDSFSKLAAALKRFPGDNLTFVIGNSYSSYAKRIENAIPVEPHTLLKELMHYIDKGGNV